AGVRKVRAGECRETTFVALDRGAGRAQSGVGVTRMKLRRGRARRAVLALGVVAMALALAGVAGSSPAGAATPTFFLVLGASDSLGVQPSLLTPHGQPTDHGYANDVVASEALHGISLALTQYGCPGETTNTMIN